MITETRPVDEQQLRPNRVTTAKTVIDKLVYTASDPVADRVHHWSGVNGLDALLAA